MALFIADCTAPWSLSSSSMSLMYRAEAISPENKNKGWQIWVRLLTELRDIRNIMDPLIFF